MEKDPYILVAADDASDAYLVRKLLKDEFDNVVVSTIPEQAIQDFEKYIPKVLILAFKTLEKAERYYLGLFRLSTKVHAIAHRTLILCHYNELQRVYELCKKEHFDDYILFWPMTNDALRLRMSVHHALRQTNAAGMHTAGEFAAQARRIVELESILQQSLAHGGESIEMADHSLKQAEKDIDLALDMFSRQLTDGGWSSLVDVKDSVGLQQEIVNLKVEKIEKSLRSVTAAVQPVRQWANNIKEEIAPQLGVVRDLRSLADLFPPTILVVEDDEFQIKLLKRIFLDANLDLIFAISGTEALNSLRKHRPNLILMDVNLPDIDGFEVTDRIKSVDQFADIPVIMITGHSGKNVVMRSLKAGVVDFVVKPFDKDTLLAKVHRFLNSISTS